MKPLLKLEITTVRHTWLAWVPPLTFLILGTLSILTARYSNEIMHAVLGTEATGLIPDPSWQQAYLQWIKNLNQIGIFVVILSGAGATSTLIADGQASLLATRPVPRCAQPLAAFTARILPIIGGYAVSTALLYAATRAFFPGAPSAPLFGASLAWLCTATVFLAIATGLSALIGSTLGAAGASIGLYLGLSILSTFTALAHRSPAGLIALPGAIITEGHGSVIVPALTATALGFAILAAGMYRFARREL